MKNKGCNYQEPFEPLMPGMKFAEFAQPDSVKALINERICAIILETVQGEGGIHPVADGFLKGVRALCDERDVLRFEPPLIIEKSMWMR